MYSSFSPRNSRNSTKRFRDVSCVSWKKTPVNGLVRSGGTGGCIGEGAGARGGAELGAEHVVVREGFDRPRELSVVVGPDEDRRVAPHFAEARNVAEDEGTAREPGLQ